MPPEAREAVAAVPGPQPERVAQARGSPSLAATLGPDADYRLSRALGDAAPHRKSFETQRHVAHAVLVVAEIHQVLPQLLSGGGFELGVSLVEPKPDGVDGPCLIASSSSICSTAPRRRETTGVATTPGFPL